MQNRFLVCLGSLALVLPALAQPDYVRELAAEQKAPACEDEKLAALRSWVEKLPDKGRRLLKLHCDTGISTRSLRAAESSSRTKKR